MPPRKTLEHVLTKDDTFFCVVDLFGPAAPGHRQRAYCNGVATNVQLTRDEAEQLAEDRLRKNTGVLGCAVLQVVSSFKRETPPITKVSHAIPEAAP